MKKIYVLLFPLFLLQVVVFAQSVSKNLSLASPNAASLGVFGEFPAISATGVPNIYIPIYDIKHNGIVIPIALQYNNNLVKPDLHPGWVGLGWNLTCGGSITRIVNDIRDEIFFQNSTSSSSGYYISHALFQSPDWDTYIKTKETTDARYNLTSKDSQPDEFIFSFLNFQGSFYIDENQTWRVRSDTKLEVVMSNSFKTFTIFDADGNQFIFGENDNDLEYEGSFIGTHNPDFKVKTWNLSKIKGKNGDEIQFIYERGSTILNPQPYWHYSYLNQSLVTREVNKLAGSQISPSYLIKIITPVSEIDFLRSNSVELQYKSSEFESHRAYYFANEFDQITYLSPNFMTIQEKTTGQFSTALFSESEVSQILQNLRFQQLDKIQVKRISDSKMIELIDFAYTNSTDHRLKLKSINSIANSRYQFYYTDDYNPSLKLPPYCSGLVDFWGYFNDRFQDYSSNSTYIASKQPDVQKLQAELLKRIVYPTKGFIDYEFEPNDYSKEVAPIRYDPLIINTQNKIGGGVRIKRISSFNSNNQPIDSREYFYNSGYHPSGSTGLSSGILGGKAFLLYYPPVTGATKGSGDMFSRVPLALSGNGNLVSYSLVTEIFSNGGYIQKTYSNFDNGINGEYMDVEPVYRMGNKNNHAFTSKAYERGRLISESVYKVDNGVQKLVNEKIFNYIRINPSVNYLRTYDIRYSSNASGVTNYSTSAIKVDIYPFLISSVQEKNYDQSDAGNEAKRILVTTDYSYNPLGQSVQASDLLPRKITITNPSGEKVITENKYVSDYSLIEDPIGPAAEGISYLHQKKITSALIESISYLQRIENSITYNYYLGGNLNKYKVFSNGKGLLWENYQLKFIPGASFISHTWSNLTGKTFIFDASKFKLVSTFEDYDSFGNPISIIPINGVKQSFNWGNFGSLLNSQSLYPQDVNFRHDVSYSHQPLVGITRITDQNSRNINFYYGIDQRLRLTTDHDNNITSLNYYNYKDDAGNRIPFSYTVQSSLGPIHTIKFETEGTGAPGTNLIWDFGDGTVRENGLSTELKDYSASGTYEVKLASKHPEYQSTVTSKKVKIRILPIPNAQITAPITGTNRTVCGNSPTTCTVTIADGPYNYQWEYQYSANGTGNWQTFGTNSNTAVYNFVGVQSSSSTIRCKATDPAGNSRYSNYITINHYCSGQPGGQNDCPSGWTWNAQFGRCDPPQNHCDEGCFWNGSQCVCY